uniref:DMAP-interaction domain-containing protein n=1 Tax=Trichuris muris TaxID=70415 RepID=A0A5S6QC21_TRIMR
MAGADLSLLPREVRDQLAQLELELSEGDITRKGYEKKKNQILSQFALTSNAGNSSPTTRAQRRRHRRATRDESRFHSEIRVEAVQQALARYSQREKKAPSVPAPVRRASQRAATRPAVSGKKLRHFCSLLLPIVRSSCPRGRFDGIEYKFVVFPELPPSCTSPMPTNRASVAVQTNKGFGKVIPIPLAAADLN